MKYNDIFCLEEMFAYLINRAAFQLKIYFARQLKSCGVEITPEQCAVLFKLAQEDGQYQRQLADKLFKDKPNISRLIDILEKDGYIRRVHDKQDRRKIKVFINDKGIVAVREIAPIMNDCSAKLHDLLSPEEHIVLRDILNRIFHEVSVINSGQDVNNES